MDIPLSGPDIGPQEKALVNEVLDSGWLSLGPKLDEFEDMMADYVGVDHAVAVNSGTSGLHLLVRAMDIGPGDEVITTPFSFIASSNCLLFEGAEPVLVDIKPDTYNIDVEKIEAAISEDTEAILPVDVFGQPAAMEDIMDLAESYDLKVIEDSCEAIGAEHRGRMVGSIAHGSVFAFYPNKQMTTGEGGIIVTDDEELARRCDSMRNQGRAQDSKWLSHVRLGYNYRLDEMSCALGIAQLERIDELLQKRKQVAEKYNEHLADVEGVKTLTIKEDTTRMSWFVYVVRITEEAGGADRNQVMQELRDAGIGCKPYFTPIHLQPFYRDKFGYEEGDYPITEKVAGQSLALPFYNDLEDEEIEYVVDKLKQALH